MRTGALRGAGRSATRSPAENAWLLALFRRRGLPAVIRALKLREAALAKRSLFKAPEVGFEAGRLTLTDAA